MTGKQALIVLAMLVAVPVALWAGFLGLAMIDSREIQTAAIAAVSSLAGAALATMSAIWLERSRRTDRSRERFEDEQLRRLNRYQELQWNALVELKSTIFGLAHQAMLISTNNTDKKSAEGKRLWLEFIAAQDVMMQLSVEVVDELPLFTSLETFRTAVIALAKSDPSSDDWESMRQTMSDAESHTLTMIHQIRRRLTYPGYAAQLKLETPDRSEESIPEQRKVNR